MFPPTCRPHPKGPIPWTFARSLFFHPPRNGADPIGPAQDQGRKRALKTPIIIKVPPCAGVLNPFDFRKNGKGGGLGIYGGRDWTPHHQMAGPSA